MSAPSIVALIPARAGSKRLPGKNVRELAGRPLLAYTIAAARASGIFSEVYVSTESPDYAAIAEQYGAKWIVRPAPYAADMSPDIEWVEHAMQGLRDDAFAILRPTSPFRTAATIKRAWREFVGWPPCDSLRAVERPKQHPSKMWVAHEDRIIPFDDFDLIRVNGRLVPPHSSPTQALPVVYAQNASLEIAWTETVRVTGMISGLLVRPFYTEAYEGFDLNTPDDWILAEALIERGLVTLPAVGE